MLDEMDLLWKFETRITEVLFLNEMTEKLSYNETDIYAPRFVLILLKPKGH